MKGNEVEKYEYQPFRYHANLVSVKSNQYFLFLRKRTPYITFENPFQADLSQGQQLFKDRSFRTRMRLG